MLHLRFSLRSEFAHRICSATIELVFLFLSLTLCTPSLLLLLSIGCSLSFLKSLYARYYIERSILCWAPQMMVFGTLQCWLLRINIPEIFWVFTYLTCRLKFIFLEYFYFIWFITDSCHALNCISHLVQIMARRNEKKNNRNEFLYTWWSCLRVLSC